MNIKQHIPNTITCGNLFCGCLAIVCAFNAELALSGYFVIVAAVLDFFDGFFARLLKVSSPIGKELDSLADMVTFGVVPGVVMFQMIKGSLPAFGILSGWETGISPQTISLVSYSGFLVTLFSALRLAKFNVDPRQSDSFIGVPTPAIALLICSIPLLIEQLTPKDIGSVISAAFSFLNNSIPSESWPLAILHHPYFLIGLTVLTSFLLISNIHLFALKFKNYAWGDNRIRYIFLIISVILFIVFQFVALPFIIILYIIMSVIDNIANRKIPNA